MKQLTIFTPTYNRAYSLPRLYDSLLKQDTSLFKWLIVDDGSTDNTKELVDGWIREGKLEIKYMYQKNAGKMAAHNLGVKECDTELFLCCDSDDWMVSNSVKSILDFWNASQKELLNRAVSMPILQKELSGMVGPRKIEGCKFNPLSLLPSDTKRSTLSGLYDNGYKGETALVFRTSILRKYPFLIIKGEKFIPESYVYDQLAEKYELLVYHSYWMECEYQEDGYTKNGLILRLKNPKGFLICETSQLKKKFSIMKALHVLALIEYIGEPYHYKELPHKFKLCFLFPFGKLLGIKYKRLAAKL